MSSSGMAIDPSLLFMQGQQQQQQQQQGQQEPQQKQQSNEAQDQDQQEKRAKGETGNNEDDDDNSKTEDKKPDVGSLTTHQAADDRGDVAMPSQAEQDQEEHKPSAHKDDNDASAAIETDNVDGKEVLLQPSEDDIALAKFLAKMDGYEPILPDAVTRYYLEKAGFQSADVRVTRMLGLAAQKFVSDIAADAYAYARVRATTGVGRAPAAASNAAAQGASSKTKDRTKTVLTLEDLSAALHEYGIDASRATYYR